MDSSDYPLPRSLSDIKMKDPFFARSLSYTSFTRENSMMEEYGVEAPSLPSPTYMDNTGQENYCQAPSLSRREDERASSARRQKETVSARRQKTTVSASRWKTTLPAVLRRVKRKNPKRKKIGARRKV
ncbi:hypothetical protein M8C21_008404 [Ambrosia artemisiifolia]|uniref:Uncharacterized protein n=1 Tax=Ambrosia artemisiifolia TaxID=4212 RepID=A0AAD5GFD9_AMBAR|nr:hypothetical protein M8C21_008404 [Ambrosia artemisiifolia]